MYDLHPPHVFVHKRVYENKKATIRMERMLQKLGNPSFEEVDENDAALKMSELSAQVVGIDQCQPVLRDYRLAQPGRQ